VCLVGSGKDFDGNAEHCNMVVTFKESTALSPDTPYPYSQQPHCRNWQTVAESDPPIQGRPAEYREFRDACTSTTTEQWTLMTDPQIVFTHPITATSSHDQFQRIVSTAQLAPPTHGSTRVFDDGIIRSVTRQADGYHITLDRVVDNLDGTQTNTNPITYNYLVVVAPIGTPPTVGAEAQIELFEPHPGPTLYEFIGMSASGHFNFKYVGGS
jgi:hypothetical protein